MSAWQSEPGWRITSTQVLKALANGALVIELAAEDQTVVAIATITAPKKPAATNQESSPSE